MIPTELFFRAARQRYASAYADLQARADRPADEELNEMKQALDRDLLRYKRWAEIDARGRERNWLATAAPPEKWRYIASKECTVRLNAAHRKWLTTSAGNLVAWERANLLLSRAKARARRLATSFH